jgi:hypothetical protein
MIQESLQTCILAKNAIIAGLITFAAAMSSPAADLSSHWLNGDGNWSDAMQWDTNPAYPNNGNGVTYDATINAGDVTLDRDITIQRLFLNGGILDGVSELNLLEGLNWTGGKISGPAGSAINLGAGSISTIAAPSNGSGNNLTARTINNLGTVNQSQGIISTDAIINNLAGATWNAQAGAGLTGFVPYQLFGPIFNNSGNFVISGSSFDTGGLFNNAGVVTIEPHNSMHLYGGGSANGVFNVAAQSSLFFSNPYPPTNSFTLTTGAVIDGAGSTHNETTLIVTGNSAIHTDFVNDGLLVVQSGATITFSGTFTGRVGSNFGGIQLAGGTITSSQNFFTGDGTLSGFGVINAPIVYVGGEGNVFPDGKLTINGLLSEGPNTFTRFTIRGLNQGTDYDYIEVNGTAGLNGVLFLYMGNGFQLQLNPRQIFTLLTSSSTLLGAFENAPNGQRLTTSDGLASFQVNYGPDSLYGANNLVLSDPILIVPEPSTICLFALGALLIGRLPLRRC